MLTKEKQEEMVFSEVLLNQKEKVEQECLKLQILINTEVSETSFIYQPDSSRINIINDIFRKSKRTRR
jgi:hypothetical protein